MKTYLNRLIIALALLASIMYSCSKKGNAPSTPPEKLPAPFTNPPDSITAVSANFIGGFFGSGGSNFMAAGFCWSTDSLPTLADNHTEVPVVAGSVVATVTGLKENTTYHVRSYAKNSAGVAYGDSRAFTTLTLKPVVRTKDIYSVSSDYAFIDGEVLSPGNSSVTTYGICWGTNSNPTINDDTTISGPDPTNFFGELDNLKVNTKYYARAYATNQYGTGYGDTLGFTTAYYIGERFGGGKIFYIAPNKVHGLIAANDDQSAGAPGLMETRQYGRMPGTPIMVHLIPIRLFQFKEAATMRQSFAKTIQEVDILTGICLQ